MARDAKLPAIELKRDDFNTEMQGVAAERLLDEWKTSFTAIAEKYGGEFDDEPGEGLYAKVYERYMGPPDEDLTVGEIRAQYGSVSAYLEAKRAGNTDAGKIVFTNSEFETWKEAYRQGIIDGLEDAGRLQ